MPTGYTAAVKDGITFRQFAMDCARAFGACVELRDEPGGGDKIPDKFEPSSYHADALAEASRSLAALDWMTPEQCERAAAKAWDDAETSRLMRLQECRDLRAKYEAMLQQVREWAPPTAEHAGLHQFMAEQLIQSINFDCNESFYDEPTERIDGAAWKSKRRAALERDVARHQREHAADVKRAAERTEWVAALRRSLGA